MSESSARGDVVIVITGDSNDAERAFDDIERRLRGLNTQVERQSRAYQTQNRSLRAALRNQRSLLETQRRYLQNLTRLNTRQNTFNQRTRAGTRALEAYRSRLRDVAEEADRIRRGGRIELPEIVDTPAVATTRRRTRQPEPITTEGEESLDRAARAARDFDRSIERARNNVDALARRNNAFGTSFVDTYRRAEQGASSFSNTLDEINRRSREGVRIQEEQARIQRERGSRDRSFAAAPVELYERANVEAGRFDDVLQMVRLNLAAANRQAEDSDRAFGVGFVRTYRRAGQAARGLDNDLRFVRESLRTSAEEAERTSRRTRGTLDNLSPTRDQNRSWRVFVGLVRDAQGAFRDIGRASAELGVIITVVAAITLIVEALGVALDLVSIGAVGLAGVFTFQLVNAMDTARRSTAATVQELQAAQQAMLRLGVLFTDQAMILERAQQTIDEARIDPQADANVFLQQFGINLTDTDRRGQSLVETIDEILNQTQDLSDSARFVALESIFGDPEVAAALIDAGDDFLGRLERAAAEIRVLTNIEIQAVRDLGGEVLAIFGTVFSDVRAFFVDNIADARTIVAIAERELVPLFRSLLNFLEQRFQSFSDDPETFVSGTRDVVGVIVEVFREIYNTMRDISEIFQRLNLSATDVTRILLVLIQISALAQLLRPLVGVFGALSGLLRLIGPLLRGFSRALGPVIESLRIGLGQLASRAGAGGIGTAVAGGGAAVGVASALGASAIVPIVAAVLAALGLTYLLSRGGEADRQRREGFQAQQRTAEETRPSATIDALVDRGISSLDSITTAVSRDIEAQANLARSRQITTEEAQRNIEQLSRSALEQIESVANVSGTAVADAFSQSASAGSLAATGSLDRLNDAAESAAASVEGAFQSGADVITGVQSAIDRDEALVRRQATQALADANQAYIETLLLAVGAYRDADSAAQPLGDHIRRLGLTFEEVSALSEALLSPQNLDDLALLQNRANVIEQETGRTLDVVLNFFQAYSTFITEQQATTLAQIEEFRNQARRGFADFGSAEEARRVLRQLQLLQRQPTTGGEEQAQIQLAQSLQAQFSTEDLNALRTSAMGFLEVIVDTDPALVRAREQIQLFANVGINAINNISSAIADVALGVRSIGDAFEQVFQGIVRDSIQAIIDLVLFDLLEALRQAGDAQRELQLSQQSRSGVSGALASGFSQFFSGGTASNAGTAVQGPVSGAGAAAEGIAAAGKPTLVVEAYAIGGADTNDVYNAAREGANRGMQEYYDNPYRDADIQRTAEGR